MAAFRVLINNPVSKCSVTKMPDFEMPAAEIFQKSVSVAKSWHMNLQKAKETPLKESCSVYT